MPEFGPVIRGSSKKSELSSVCRERRNTSYNQDIMQFNNIDCCASASLIAFANVNYSVYCAREWHSAKGECKDFLDAL